MGIPWSQVLYPDNSVRRDQVNLLAQQIRNCVIDFYAQVRTLAGTLHRKASSEFADLSPFDYKLTFQQNLDKVAQLMEQWKGVVEKLEKDPSIPQRIRDVVEKLRKVESAGQFPDVVKELVGLSEFQQSGAGAAVGFGAGAAATVWLGWFFKERFESLVKTVALSGLLGALAGVAIAEIVNLIIAAFQGYAERNRLEELKENYIALYQKLSNATEELRPQIEDIVYDIIILTRANKH